MSKADLVVNGQEVHFDLSKEGFKVSSLDVAKVFEKRHDHVIRDIEAIVEKSNRLNIKDLPKFGEIFYEDKYGRKQKAYLLDRDAFSLLAMGFSGDKAFVWRSEFLNAFNEMEKIIRDQEKVKGFMEDSKITGLPKTKLIKAYYRTDTNKERKELATLIKEISIKLEKVESLKDNLVPMDDLRDQLQQDLIGAINMQNQLRELEG